MSPSVMRYKPGPGAVQRPVKRPGPASASATVSVWPSGRVMRTGLAVSAMVRRVKLATTAGQLESLLSANATGSRLCPRREMASLGVALSDAYLITQDQAASA